MLTARPRLLLLVAALGGCSFGLEHGLDERPANEVIAALEGAGIAADKVADEVPGRWQVLVARSDVGRALSVLAARSLPRRAPQGLRETFAERGLLPSPTAERARLQAALTAELERTLAALPGVSGARVHLALPVDDPLRGDAARARPTASLLLQGTPLVAEPELRRLVAGAIEGLHPADVAVVLAPAAEAVAAPALVALGPLRLAASSRGLAGGLFAGALIVILVLSLLLALGALRLGALRRRLRGLEGGEAAGDPPRQGAGSR